MPTTPPISSSAPATRPDFDNLSFRKSVKYIGRSYRKRAMELVSICRTFVQAQIQTPDSHYKLRSVLELVDHALKSATEAGKKTSNEADEAFTNAASKLSDYGRVYHPNVTVAERIEMAEKTDKSSLKLLNRMMETFRAPEEGRIQEVKFLIHKSLPDNDPTVVKQVLCSMSNLNEILWNFRRPEHKKGRLTLKQNPHFYEVLPTSPERYGGGFEMMPTDKYLHGKIDVLTDNSGQAGRVFLKTAKKTRAFGNAWDLKNAIIFKDVCGKLEGERIVGKTIKDTPNLWCFRELPPSHTSPPSPSSNRSCSSPTTAATPTTCPKGLLLTDWREPIRQMLRSPDVNIRISTKPPINSFPSSPAPSSPQSGFNSSVGSLPSISELPPTESSPRSPAPPEPSFKLPSQPTAAPALSTSAPFPIPLPPQPPSVAPPSTSSATPARTTLPLPDTHPRGVSREDSTLPMPLPSQPPSVTSPSTSSATPAGLTRSLPESHSRGASAGVTVTPHVESHEAKVAGHVPGHQHVGAKVVTPGPLPQQHVPAVVPILQAPEPQTQKRKKNWFQRHVYDYGK
ncbi:hypothetical protein V8E52_010714 [Russula decolorans]